MTQGCGRGLTVNEMGENHESLGFKSQQKQKTLGDFFLKPWSAELPSGIVKMPQVKVSLDTTVTKKKAYFYCVLVIEINFERLCSTMLQCLVKASVSYNISV